MATSCEYYEVVRKKALVGKPVLACAPRFGKAHSDADCRPVKRTFLRLGLEVAMQMMLMGLSAGGARGPSPSVLGSGHCLRQR